MLQDKYLGHRGLLVDEIFRDEATGPVCRDRPVEDGHVGSAAFVHKIKVQTQGIVKDCPPDRTSSCLEGVCKWIGVPDQRCSWARFCVIDWGSLELANRTLGIFDVEIFDFSVSGAR